MADNQFDALIRSLAFIGFQSYEDLVHVDRLRLTRLYLEINQEIGEALYFDMVALWDAFEAGDKTRVGEIFERKSLAYVKNFIDRQLGEHADNMRQRRNMERRRFAGVDQE